MIWAEQLRIVDAQMQIYQSKTLGFEIRYPKKWVVSRDGKGYGKDNPYYIGFGEPGLASDNYDGEVGISIHKKSQSLESIADQMGSQFGDKRKIERKRIKIGELQALRQRVTVPGLKDWDCRAVYLENTEWVFEIGNGCMTRSISEWKRIFPTFRFEK